MRRDYHERAEYEMRGVYQVGKDHYVYRDMNFGSREEAFGYIKHMIMQQSTMEVHESSEKRLKRERNEKLQTLLS